MLILEIIAAVIGTILVAIIANTFGIGDKKPKYDTISLKESMDLCNLPVITFINNGNKFHFVLDTGSSESHVSESAIANMVGEDSNRSISVQGFTGSAESVNAKVVDLIYKDKVFTTEVFVSSALDSSFADIKQNLGVQLHGIIGSTFMKNYGYVLDFDDLIAYAKK